jgi:hypothetical protein
MWHYAKIRFENRASSYEFSEIACLRKWDQEFIWTCSKYYDVDKNEKQNTDVENHDSISKWKEK